MPTVRRILIAALGLALASPLALPRPVVAASTLVQHASVDAAGCGPVTVTLPAGVTAGDVIVVGVFTFADGLSPSGVADTQTTTYDLMVSETSDGLGVSLFAGTLTGSGSDPVTVSFTCVSGDGADVYVFEVAGVSVQGAVTGAGSGSGYPDAMSTGSVAFQPGAFLIGLGMAYPFTGCLYTAGTGFSLDAVGSSVTEFATTGVASPTTFPMTPSNLCDPWVEVGLALNPTATPTRGIGSWRNDPAATGAGLPESLGSYDVTSWTDASKVFTASNCGKPRGDAVNCLAGQLLAAKLNLANGSDDCLSSTVASADTLLTGVPYLGPSTTYRLSKSSRASAVGLESVIEAYNRGAGCP